MQVSGRHGTTVRFRIVRAVLILATLAGLAAIATLGGCLIGGRSGPDFNAVQRYRLRADAFVKDQVLFRFGVIRAWPDARPYLLTNELWGGERLHGEVWAVFAVVWLAVFGVLRVLNRPFLSGRLLATRTTVLFTPEHVVLYRWRLFPRRFARDAVGAFQFRADPHPRLQRGRGVPQATARIYQDSGHVVMIYGLLVVPVATIIGAEAAGQFALCCDFAFQATASMR